MLKRLVLLLLLFVLSGCATRWTHPTKTAMDFERDKRRCMNEAAIQAQAWGSPGNPFMIADDTRKCLEIEYGWTAVRE